MTVLLEQPRDESAPPSRPRIPARVRLVAGAVGAALVTGVVMGIATSVAGRWS